jgi:hypothetical protein
MLIIFTAVVNFLVAFPFASGLVMEPVWEANAEAAASYWT